MNKISLIIRREYLTRVRKKSFIIMSVLGPFIFAAFLFIPAWLATLEDKEIRTVAVVDSTNIFSGVLPETEYIKFTYLHDIPMDEIRTTFQDAGYSAVLFIPHNIMASNSIILYSDKQPGLSIKMHISNSIEKEIEKLKLNTYEINNLEEILKSIETSITLRSIVWTEEGGEKESFTELSMIVGYASGMLIYVFIFLFGVQVMRGVIEEKSNRIIEVIISSVKPFQLMMGKIIGVGLTGLTQFIIWVVLTLTIVTAAQKAFFPDLGKTSAEQIIARDIHISAEDNIQTLNLTENNPDVLEKIYTSLNSIHLVYILGMFLFFFLGGYLLYASFFAIVGSAVDNEADTQQFMFPITIPLIAAIFIMVNAINNPESPLAFWFSLIPLTSPVVMMVRIPFGVKVWELVLSAGLLIITFIGSTWMAGKIYRTGILMYGKKVNYKELWKWLRYKTY